MLLHSGQLLLTNIGDIRSESVHDINKIRARRTGANKAARRSVAARIFRRLHFIYSRSDTRVRYFFFFFDSNIRNIRGRFDLSSSAYYLRIRYRFFS